MTQWKSTLMSPNTTIIEAIQIIDASVLQIGLVVSEQGRLLGTVTDGDIRRAILKGTSLDQPIEKIMFKKPTTAGPESTREEILQAMKRKELRHIPIVDKDGCVIDLKVLVHMLKDEEKKNWIVLMAGGQGTRLKPLTDNCPKPMLKIGGKPILETILENCISDGFSRFYISVNYKAEMITEYFGNGRRYGAEIQYLTERQQLGTAGALSLFPEIPKDTFIVMNADVLTKINLQHLLNFHAEHKAVATMCVKEYKFQVPYGVVNIQNYNVLEIREKPKHSFFVNAGVYALEPKALEFITKQKRIDMTTLFESMIKKNFETAVFPIREYWIDIGRLDDYKQANGEYRNYFE